jgi:hypothetical protein
MFTEEIMRRLLGAVVPVVGVPMKRRAKEAAFAAGSLLVVVWCAKMAVLVLAATAGLALVPKVGPIGATGIVGLGFLVLGGLIYVVYSRRRRDQQIRRRLDTTALRTPELQQQTFEAMRGHLVPLLIAGVATFLVSRLTQRD